jgi:hypothetical protein
LKSLAESFAKLRRLPPQERRLLAQVWLLLLATDLALRLLPFPLILEYCRHQILPQEKHSVDLRPPVSRLARLVETAGRYCPMGTSCLKEALVLSWLLARRGMPATLRIGVGRPDGTFAAHAWLEQDGRVIFGDRGRDAYAPLLSRLPMRSHRS